MLKNEKKVECPRCKGKGVIRGQMLAWGKHLPNYKHVKGGVCFACEGTGKVYLIDDKFIGISHYDKNKLVQYDSNGVCIGAYEYKCNNEPDEIMLFEDEVEHSKEELVQIEKRYQHVIVNMIHGSLEVLFKNQIVDIYNDEENILCSSVWKGDKEIIEKFKEENEKTIRLLDTLLSDNKRGLTEAKLEKLELFKYYANSRYKRVVLDK